ncbi:hypothetical protein D3C77_360460 [compost metagenome]
MGTNVKSANLGSIWYVKVEPPVTRNLEGWFTLDSDPSRFWFNRAPDKPDAVVVGSPTAFAGYGRFKGNTNYLQTHIPDSDEVTIIAVSRAAVVPTGSADGVFIVGAHAGSIKTPGYTGEASGANLYLDHQTASKASASRDDGLGAVTPANIVAYGTPPGNWALKSIRAKSGSPTIMVDHTAGLVTIGVISNNRVLTNNLYRIGSATRGFPGEADISFVAIHSGYLTDAEIAAQIVPIRKRMARLGISV